MLFLKEKPCRQEHFSYILSYMFNMSSWIYEARFLPRHEGSIVKRGLIIIKSIKELRFGGA